MIPVNVWLIAATFSANHLFFLYLCWHTIVLLPVVSYLGCVVTYLYCSHMPFAFPTSLNLTSIIVQVLLHKRSLSSFHFHSVLHINLKYNFHVHLTILRTPIPEKLLVYSGLSRVLLIFTM